MIPPPATEPPPPPPGPRPAHGGWQSKIILPTALVGQLVDYALVMLWQADQNDDGCCPLCCNPCNALQALDRYGELDRVAAPYSYGSLYWDGPRNQIDREWLTRAWRKTDCHE